MNALKTWWKTVKRNQAIKASTIGYEMTNELETLWNAGEVLLNEIAGESQLKTHANGLHSVMMQIKHLTELLEKSYQAALMEIEGHDENLADKNKHIQDLELSLARQLETIQDQSATLTNRQKRVDVLKAELSELRDKATVSNIVNELEGSDAAQFFEVHVALRQYAVRLAENAQDGGSAQTAVHLIQLARIIENIDDWESAYRYLVTGHVSGQIA